MRSLTRLVPLVLLLLLLPAAGSGAAYSRRWSVVAGGGGTLRDAGSGYRVGGTVGQPLAGLRAAPPLRVVLGFWSVPWGTGWVGVPDPAVPPPTALHLSAPYPNPAREAVSIALDLPAAAALDVRVLDLQGRRVRALAGGPFGAGRHHFSWDGRDESGHRAPPGLYFVRADAGPEHRVARFVLLGPGGAR